MAFELLQMQQPEMWVPRWQSFVDFIVLLTAVYLLLVWGKQARALRIALGIVGLRVAAILAQQLDLVITTRVLDAATLVAVVLLLVVFQHELRRALLHLDILVQRWRWRRRVEPLEPAFIAISEAAFALARSGRGALVVIVRRDSIDDLITGGVALGGEISKEIIETIFRKVSPVHDGATIIENNRIARVAAILPLTERESIPSGYGTRHRAALGLAERSDAIIVVVSEEIGIVTLVHGSESGQIDQVQDLVRRLEVLCRHPAVEVPRLRRNLGLKAAAVALAMLIWVISFGLTGTSVLTLVVPVEFSNVPAGLKITNQSSTTLQVQLRGPAWLFESASLASLAARFDLRGSGEGSQSLTLQENSLDLPPGVQVERSSPGSISVELMRQ